MTKIITTSQVQKRIGEISSSIDQMSFIVTNRGEGKIVMLPYFEGCDEKISEYLEDYEMFKNQKKLREKYAVSAKSGKSDFVI